MLISQTTRPHLLVAALLAAAMAVVVGTALGFEHIGGFIPCKLCLEQRLPYYAGIPVALVTFIAALLGWHEKLVRAGLMIVGLLMAYGLALGVYHAGIEWSWWMGPADCSTSSTTGITTDATDLLGALDAIVPPACDQAAGRFLGLSFAGWNVIASLCLMMIAFRTALAKRAG